MLALFADVSDNERMLVVAVLGLLLTNIGTAYLHYRQQNRKDQQATAEDDAEREEADDNRWKVWGKQQQRERLQSEKEARKREDLLVRDLIECRSMIAQLTERVHNLTHPPTTEGC